jgi:hypothetical protein
VSSRGPAQTWPGDPGQLHDLGAKQDRSARAIITGHALVQNLRRGHYALAAEEPAGRRLAAAFDELALTI